MYETYATEAGFSWTFRMA